MTTVKDAVREFLQARKADGVSASTMRWYRSLLMAYSDIQSGMVGEVSASAIRSYIVALRERTTYEAAPQRPATGRRMSAASVDSHIRAIHAFWSWAAVEYGIPNPAANIKYPKVRFGEPKAIAPADFVKLFNATGDDTTGIRNRALLAFLADTGARLGGVCGLKLRDLNLTERRAVVREKGGKQRNVVFTMATAQFLTAWLAVRQSSTDAVFVSVTRSRAGLTGSGVAQMLERLKASAGVTGRVNPHSFRHNFARAYLMNGGDIVTLARLLGHSNINVTAAFYALFTQDELADLHEKRSPLKSMM